MLLAFVAVTVAAIIVFRSLTAGLLAAMPVGLSVLAGLCGHGVCGDPAWGRHVDVCSDRHRPLHRLCDPRAGRDQGYWPQQRARAPGADGGFIRETGRALFFNFIAVAVGFGVLMTSDVPPLIKFGSLVAVAVSVAFIASVTLLPALVTLLKPKALLAPEPKEAAHASRPQTV
ncbi:MMPL family transporter [Roseovarius confluentis]|uniref:MMPL family transporter n=1 Tax=Roseovarius confluentis TaxID=1852027 RepID=UPI003BABC551